MGAGFKPWNFCLSTEVSPPFVAEMKLLTKDCFQYNFITFACSCNTLQKKKKKKVGARSSNDMLLRSEAASDLDNPADRFINIQLVTQSL